MVQFVFVWTISGYWGARTRCIIRTWKALSLWPRAFQTLILHLVGKCTISTWAWVLAFIPWPVRNIKTAMQKSCISTHPLSAELCLDHGIISKAQFKWRKGHSTTTYILSLLIYIYGNIGKLVRVVFLDLKNAFNTVDHTALKGKLSKYGICFEIDQFLFVWPIPGY